jgi:hypothetical protein
LLPVRVTDTFAPRNPKFGLSEATPGSGGLTVNVAPPLVPPEVVIVTFAPPNGAFAAIAKVAVICVALTTTTLLAVTPAPVFTTAPERKFAPVKVTPTLVPTAPDAGLTELSEGGGGLIVNGTAPLAPPDVVTVTLPAPIGALAAIVNVAVIWLALTTATLLTETPAGAETAVPGTKLLPLSVTVTAEPAIPDTGVIALSPGGGGTMVNTAAGDVPPAVVTVTFTVPNVALAGIVKVAVICVVLATTTLPAVIPPPAFTVAPLTKLLPVRVTGTLVPVTPELGATFVSPGEGGLIVKVTAAVVPPGVVTVTLTGPSAAFPATPNVAVI